MYRQFSTCTIALSSFSTPGLPGDVFIISSLSCPGYNLMANVSQCGFQFVTKSSTCDVRYAAGLHCEGKLPTSVMTM